MFHVKSSVFLFYLVNLIYATLYEGDPCQLPFQEQGKCVRLSQCPSAVRLVRSRQHPKTCSFIRSTPIVCCPISAGPLNPRLSERKCQKYKMLSQSTTIPTDIDARDQQLFVVGGVRSLAKEFPHMAALGFTNYNQTVWLCGGSLISERFVLTAAHCLYFQEYGPVQWARLGALDLNSTSDNSSPEDYNIIRRIPYPRFKSPSVYDDIALVELSQYIDHSNYIKPACLSTDSFINPSAQLIATGWGLTEIGGRQSDYLQKVDLELFTHEECDNAYDDSKNSRTLRVGIVYDSMFCAGGRNEEKDTCQGDSGGPVQIKYENTYIVVGVTSFGKSCGVSNIPGVYTKVAPYISWIESVVWPDEF